MRETSPAVAESFFQRRRIKYPRPQHYANEERSQNALHAGLRSQRKGNVEMTDPVASCGSLSVRSSFCNKETECLHTKLKLQN